MRMTCSTCVHDGECGLYCGGSYYMDNVCECAVCGDKYKPEEMEEIDGNILCPKCAVFIVEADAEDDEPDSD